MSITFGGSDRAAKLVQGLIDRVPKHPVGMTTVYRTVALLNYSIDPAVLRRLVPEGLELDLANGRGYVTVVCADMVRMRPAPLPRALGITYDQVVYRVPVRDRDEPGLFFLGSDAAQRLMVVAGAVLSMFRVRRSATRITDAGDRVSVDVFGSKPGVDLHAFLKFGPDADGLPETSSFSSTNEAVSFLVDRFVAFVPDPGDGPMRRVRVRRGSWAVQVASTTDIRSEILDASADFPAGSARLDHALVARHIPYHWYPAEVEQAPGIWRRPRLSVAD